MRITDRDRAGHVVPPIVSPELSADMAAATIHTAAAFHAVRDLGLTGETAGPLAWECQMTDPYRGSHSGHVVVEYRDRFGRYQRRTICQQHLLERLATLHGDDVVVWTRSDAADLAVMPDLGFRPVAPRLVVIDGRADADETAAALISRELPEPARRPS